MRNSKRSHLPLTSAAIALASVLAVFLIRLSLAPVLADQQPYAFFYVAVAFTVWKTGWRGALLAWASSSLLANHFFSAGNPAAGFFVIKNVVGFSIFSIVCAMIIVLGSQSRRARVRAEAAAEQLRQTVDQLRANFELTSVGQAQADAATGKFLRVNRRLCHLTGYAEDELLERTFVDITHPEERQRDQELFRRLVAGEIDEYVLDKRYVRKDGRFLWVHANVTLVRDPHGTPLHTVAVIQDITVRKQAERRIATESAVLKVLSESGTIGTAMPELLRAVCESSDWNAGVFWQVNAAQNRIEPQEWWAADAAGAEFCRETRAHWQFEVGQGVPGRVWRTREPLWVQDLQIEIEPFSRMKLAVQAGIRSACATPVLIDGAMFGMMEFFAREPRPEDAQFLQMMRDIGLQAGQFIQRRRAELALLESEQTFRRIVETANEGIWILDEHGVVTLANRRIAEMLCYTEEELKGRSKFDFAFPEDRPTIEAYWSRRQRGVSEQIDVRFRRKDGVEIWLIMAARSIVEGGVFRGALDMFTDVTERRRAEQELVRNEARLRTAMDAGRLGVWEWEIPHNRVVWSERLYDFHGLKPAQFGGTVEDFTRLVHPDDLPRVSEAIAKAIEQQAMYALEFRALRPDGEVRWLSTSARVIYDETGKPLRMLGGTIDLTKQKEVELALRDAEKLLTREAHHLEKLVAERTVLLEESLRSVEGLCYTIAHDLRAPLRAMQGFARALSEDYAGRLDPAGSDYAQRIMRAALRMDSLITDLLAYGRLGMTEMTLHTIELDTVIDGFLTDYAEEIKQRQATICVERLLPVVVANRTMLSQAVANLLINAMKFVAPGVLPQVRVYAENHDSVTRLCVEDNGIGIAREHEHKLFQIFQRLHSPEQYAGTGIGLAIVKKAVERMNGRVGVRSEPGKGSTFWIELPTGEATSKPAMHASLPRAGEPPGARG